MKANEFVKKYGWSSLKIAVTLPTFYRYKYVIFYSDEIDFKNEFIEKHKEYMFEIREVKRLVESHNLVERIGGLCEAKKRLEQADKEFSLLISFRNKYNELCSVYDHVLKQAIADVESCQ